MVHHSLQLQRAIQKKTPPSDNCVVVGDDSVTPECWSADHSTCKITCDQQCTFGSDTVVMDYILEFCKAFENRVLSVVERLDALAFVASIIVLWYLGNKCKSVPSLHSICICIYGGQMRRSFICCLHCNPMVFGQQMQERRISPPWLYDSSY
jgi:hypothetical protein